MPTLALAPTHNRLVRSWRLFDGSAVAASHTGDTIETLLARVSLPAACMGPNGILYVSAMWSFSNNGSTKGPAIYMGPAGIAAGGGQAIFKPTTVVQFTTVARKFIRNRNNQAQQVSEGTASSGIGTVSSLLITTIDTTAAFDVIFCGKCPVNADFVTLESYSVEILYGA